MNNHDGSWRLAVLARSTVVGTGFVVDSRHALTCAHVVAGRERCAVHRFGHRRAEAAARVSIVPAYAAGNTNADIGVIELPGPLDVVAPLGSAALPASGTVVSLLGLPQGREREGRWVDATVMGPDRSGEWLQIDALNPLGTWVDHGFSGGAVVDRESGLVVGMVARKNHNPAARNAWFIPLATLAAYWPPLRSMLSGALAADAGFRAFRAALSGRRYTDALTELSAVQRRFPRESAVYYYWALAALAGTRPAHHAGQTIDGVIRLLLEARSLDPRSTRAAALLALVCEDYFVLRRLPLPRVSGLSIEVPSNVSAADAREIVDHVPATDCPTWRFVNNWSRRR